MKLPPIHIANRLACALVIILVTIAAAGCQETAFIYVDNGATRTMVVSIDGQEVASVAPGESERVPCAYGKRFFEVKCGFDLCFVGTKDVEPTERLGVPRRLLFNPDKSQRYVKYSIDYGEDVLGGVMEATVRQAAGAEVEDPVKLAYEELTSGCQPMPDEPWLDVTDVEHVLSSPPEVVVTQYSHEVRYGLSRCTPADHAFLTRAAAVKDPDENDLVLLLETVDRILYSTISW